VSALLDLENVCAGYGESIVVEDTTLTVREGESVALLGRNGVGKTTLVTTIVGETRLHRGTLRWKGREITRVATHARVALGIGWVPQERGMWRSLTVDEHLAAVGRPGTWTIDRVYGLFPRLAQRRTHRGLQLSGGEQQMLAIARALVTNPALLLLDEPLEGLAPLIVHDLVTVLRELSTSGATAMLLVEQHARLALSLAPRALVMDRGRIVTDAPSERLVKNPSELERWLAVG